MIASVDSSQFLNEVARESTGTDQEVAAQFTGLSSAQLNWKPDAATWSIGQEFDHILKANRTYVAVMQKVIASAGAPRPTFKPSFWGKLIYKAAKPGRSMNVPVPKPLVPTDQALDVKIVRDYLELQKAFDELLEQARETDLDARFVSPLAAIARMRLGDAFRITAAHNRRHIDKAQRLLADPGFPKA